MTIKRTSAAEMADFKFNMTLSKVLENTQDAVDRMDNKHYDFNAAANDITQVTLYLKHYAKIENIGAGTLPQLFKLDDQKTELERRFRLVHGADKLIDVRQDAELLYAHYTNIHPELKI